MFFSFIIPLYNRPLEIQELLESLVHQEYKRFEVIVVEDGSTIKAEDIVLSFRDRLAIKYYHKENGGQGFARNYGFQRASGDFFIILDSDVIVPPRYLQHVLNGLERDSLDAFGGPDAAHECFTSTQRAISYAMTSPLTTGGIRGNKKHVGVFHPRSFNMGISRKVWEATGGFRLSRRSEDIEFSIRTIASGFKVGLIPEAFVYHKRRTDFSRFYKQIHAFGKGRVDIWKLYPKELKFVHLLPSIFVAGLIVLVLLNVFNILTDWGVSFFSGMTCFLNMLFLLYSVTVFAHAYAVTKNIAVAAKSIIAAYVQFVGYGLGFIVQFLKTVSMKQRS